jgi:hypothetical protein
VERQVPAGRPAIGVIKLSSENSRGIAGIDSVPCGGHAGAPVGSYAGLLKGHTKPSWDTTRTMFLESTEIRGVGLGLHVSAGRAGLPRFGELLGIGGKDFRQSQPFRPFVHVLRAVRRNRNRLLSRMRRWAPALQQRIAGAQDFIDAGRSRRGFPITAFAAETRFVPRRTARRPAAQSGR